MAVDRQPFDQVLEALPSIGNGVFLIAYSGGIDSTALLHFMATNFAAGTVRAVHVQHDLQPAAVDWAAHCQRQAQALGVAISVCEVRVNRKHSNGLEASARAARYQALAAAMRPDDVLLTAHQAEDQAQTFLLQALRGSGVRGLAAMPRQARFGPGWHVRPLLTLTRDHIRTYAREHRLHWVDDPSNVDLAVDRSYLDTQIWPHIKAHWPWAAGTLSRAAIWCAENALLAKERAAEDQALCVGSVAISLSISRLLTLSGERRRNLLRAWLDALELPSPRAQHVVRIETECLAARPDALPCVSWPGAEVRRYRDDLYALRPLSPLPLHWSAAWAPPEPLPLPGGARLMASKGQGGLAMGPRYQVRFRCPGDKLQLPGRTHETPLKNLFQEAAVPTWIRNRVPLIIAENRIAAVADLCVSEEFLASGNTPGWCLRWCGAPPGWAAANQNAVNRSAKIG